MLYFQGPLTQDQQKGDVTDHRQLLQLRVLQDQLLQALLQPDERVISYLPEDYVFSNIGV